MTRSGGCCAWHRGLPLPSRLQCTSVSSRSRTSVGRNGSSADRGGSSGIPRLARSVHGNVGRSLIKFSAWRMDNGISSEIRAAAAAPRRRPATEKSWSRGSGTSRITCSQAEGRIEASSGSRAGNGSGGRVGGVLETAGGGVVASGFSANTGVGDRTGCGSAGARKEALKPVPSESSGAGVALLCGRCRTSEWFLRRFCRFVKSCKGSGLALQAGDLVTGESPFRGGGFLFWPGLRPSME
mmetsp:Transcript_57113/g.152892  ORF Transcript_57113/g.152892 Transcript_57113/m.152892 type:complete len:240 (+) Transcript_57113:611-1330(+)